MDESLDRSPRQRFMVVYLDFLHHLAKVRVAGSSPVVRSTVVRSTKCLVNGKEPARRSTALRKCPKRIDAIAMSYRYEWRAMSYALFLYEDLPQ